ncbi:MAG TPA: citrate lyase holo-[acyl-carrier protein] synthase [Atopostipes sp.]|jgi:Phosphoribosyl-dephospho-CoA transferase (holo-ACP synthetase)|nr:citrate lyase holo-[acyl-carrier protein] synthase [Atopostipes sp.]
MVNIEENHPLGRLFDLDVLMLDQNNEVQGKSRTKLGLPVRRCFLCERPAKDCGRSRRHTVLELQEEISNRIQNYFKN